MKCFIARIVSFFSVGLSLLAMSSFATATEDLEAQHDVLIELARAEDSDFATALADAEFPESWLLEAEIVRALTIGDMEGLLKLPSRIDSTGDDFRLGLGRTFVTGQQLDGFSDTLKCVIAYKSEDKERFEEFAISSFAKAPSFNKLFGIADLLARSRMEDIQDAAMEGVGIPMDMVVANVEGEERTLRDWMGSNKAMLVDFWASWCGPCIRLMPSLREKAETLPAQGVFVAGINIDQAGQVEKAKKVREERDMSSVPWLIDPNGGKLSNLLMIDSIPRMLLIDPEGKVLYNGHPSDPALGVALGKIGVTLAH